MSCDCCIALARGAISLSAVCNCGISLFTHLLLLTEVKTINSNIFARVLKVSCSFVENKPSRYGNITLLI